MTQVESRKDLFRDPAFHYHLSTQFPTFSIFNKWIKSTKFILGQSISIVEHPVLVLIDWLVVAQEDRLGA